MDIQRHFENSDALCEYVKTLSPTVVLSFSRGKDSIAAWLQLKAHGFKVIPVHMHSVPGISFVDESLRYYEDVFQTKIYNMPHPSFYRWLAYLIFQSPDHWPAIVERDLPDYNLDDLFNIVKASRGYPLSTFTAVGVTQFDSLTRRASISRFGPLNPNRRQFFPIYDWNKPRIVREIRLANIKLPKEYRIFGRSWDGIDFRFIEPIKRHYPDDYARILEWFPVLEIEIKRYQWRKEHLDAQAAISKAAE